MLFVGIGLTDTRELEGMASRPAAKNTFNVKEFDELTGLAEDIFGGEACGKFKIICIICLHVRNVKTN